MGDNYSEVHRKHMRMDLERQDREWARLNIKKKTILDKYHTWWVALIWVVGGAVAAPLFWVALDHLGNQFR